MLVEIFGLRAGGVTAVRSAGRRTSGCRGRHVATVRAATAASRRNQRHELGAGHESGVVVEAGWHHHGRRRPQRGQAGTGHAEQQVLHAGRHGEEVLAVAERVVGVGSASGDDDRRCPPVLDACLVDLLRRDVGGLGDEVGGEQFAKRCSRRAGEHRHLPRGGLLVVRRGEHQAAHPLEQPPGHFGSRSHTSELRRRAVNSSKASRSGEENSMASFRSADEVDDRDDDAKGDDRRAESAWRHHGHETTTGGAPEQARRCHHATRDHSTLPEKTRNDAAARFTANASVLHGVGGVDRAIGEQPNTASSMMPRPAPK